MTSVFHEFLPYYLSNWWPVYRGIHLQFACILVLYDTKQRLVLTTSKIAYWSPTFMPGTMPAPPTRPAPMLLRMFPYRLGRTNTSNCCGRDTICQRRKEMFYLTMHSTLFIYGYMASVHIQHRKEGNVLLNDALNTFYLRLYGVRHMVKYHSDSERKPAAATWATLSD